MKLERARELYSDYAEGALSPDFKLALDQHFQSDPSAKEDFFLFSEVLNTLNVPVEDLLDVPHGFRAQIMAQVTAQAQQPTSKKTLRQMVAALFPSRDRTVTGGLLVGCAALAVAGIFIFANPISGPKPACVGPCIGTTNDSPAITVRTSTTTQDDGTLQHIVKVQLSADIPNATVTADLLPHVADLMDTDLRGKEAVTALNQPVQLTGGKELDIPVTVASDLPADSALTVYVDVKDATGKDLGSQVVFEPVDPNAAIQPITTSPSGYFDALQQIAGHDKVTIIADAGSEPKADVSTWIPRLPAEDAIRALLAGVAKRTLHKIDNTTFEIVTQ